MRRRLLLPKSFSAIVTGLVSGFAKRKATIATINPPTKATAMAALNIHAR